MIGSLVKMFAYNKAPRTTFAVAHPRKSLKLWLFRKEFRTSPVPRIAAIGAAAVALPLGLALGRLTKRSRNGDDY
jgi:hypothetical protein